MIDCRRYKIVYQLLDNYLYYLLDQFVLSFITEVCVLCLGINYSERKINRLLNNFEFQIVRKTVFYEIIPR
jgi:hypothetical protein